MLLVGLGAEVNAVDNKEVHTSPPRGFGGEGHGDTNADRLGCRKRGEEREWIDSPPDRGVSRVTPRYHSPSLTSSLSSPTTLTLVYYSLIYTLRERGRLWSWEQT